MEKRYQVFVSSTYDDLQEERQEVMHALLELDCIPSGMELFPAANESQWSLIKRVIDDCDYYILIVAARYGSIGSDGYSYTEMEYQYAESSDKPIIAFLHKNPGDIPSSKCESTEEGRSKLELFRKKVEMKLCKFWQSPAELGSVVSRSLIQLIKTTPAVGWVRADELPDRDATLELLKLRKTVDELQLELYKARITAPKGTEEFAQGEELHTVKYNFRSRNSAFETTNWNASIPIPWNTLFRTVAPLMINEATEPVLKRSIDGIVEQESFESLQKNKKLKDCTIDRFSVDVDDFHTIKVQFRALGLIRKSDKPRRLF